MGSFELRIAAAVIIVISVALWYKKDIAGYVKKQMDGMQSKDYKKP